ncbi:CubicO group peptidase (beta-lactamase class C family) [Scopulibacillus daqui]|uniref:CubicO group peptidase (Beta-lactamase class C family) n=1 Tax=Scopulibacillus daqui TaxID=1469162 RepID=A0ABS2PXV2_9BACL|nr:serine hydrolase domain-containing protein [Scopulibacillus daqui]MBM7644852.1 CubicO group peptidase (beta-lactamase class C family) [Scopulibacillus daqui]
MQRRIKRKSGFKKFIAFCGVAVVIGIGSFFLYSKHLSAKNVQTEGVQYLKEKTIHTEHKAAENQTVETKRPTANIVRNKDIDQYLKRVHFNGTAFIVKNGRVIINKGYGFANINDRIKNNPNTVYYIGSVTKPVVATAVMQLQQQGKININDPLSKYLPSFPNANKIKIFNLLTHTSGIGKHLETKVKLSPNKLVKRIGFDSEFLKFQPGTQFDYNDANYSVLGYLVEKISGEPLHEYIKEHIFKPAGMNQSGFGSQLKNEMYPSTGYKILSGLSYKPIMPDFSQIFGCGDIYMTAEDLYKFDRALASGKLISKQSYQQMMTPYKHHYGFGWYVNRPGWYMKPTNFSNHGVLSGWNAMNGYQKDGSEYVVLLSNIQNNIKNLGLLNKTIYAKLDKTDLPQNQHIHP